MFNAFFGGEVPRYDYSTIYSKKYESPYIGVPGLRLALHVQTSMFFETSPSRFDPGGPKRGSLADWLKIRTDLP